MIFDGCSGSWFAVQVRTRCEFLISSLLANKGYEIYAPSYRPEKVRTRAAREKNLALLPGYIFCRFDSALNAPILTTPGVIRIVGFGKNPIPISPEELESVSRAEGRAPDIRPHPFLTAGQQVRVEEGPLAGVQGVFRVMKGSGCLVLSVNLIQRSVCVQLRGCRVTPIAS